MMKLFKKHKSFAKKRESLWLDMSFYWEVAVFCMLMVALLAVLFGGYYFFKINKELIIEDSDITTNVPTVKKQRIEKVLDYFSARKEKSNQITNFGAPIGDPSL